MLSVTLSFPFLLFLLFILLIAFLLYFAFPLFFSFWSEITTTRHSSPRRWHSFYPFYYSHSFIHFIHFIHSIPHFILIPFILVRFRRICELQQNPISFPFFLFLNVPGGGLVERITRIERFTSDGFLVENTMIFRSLEFVPLNANAFNELTIPFNSFKELTPPPLISGKLSITLCLIICSVRRASGSRSQKPNNNVPDNMQRSTDILTPISERRP